MTADFTPARRFFVAARAAAARVGSSEALPDLLLRFGFPGLMTRIGVEPPVRCDVTLLRAQKLYHSIVFDEADRISAALRASGTPHFFAKGIALAGRVYQRGDRLVGDIDIYVPPAARAASLETLRHLGYEPLPEHQQAGPTELRSALALMRGTAGDIMSVGVDLHWALDPVDRLLPRNDHPLPANVWERVIRLHRVNTPHAEHHAAILVHHLVHTDLLHVRSLLDLAFVFQEFDQAGGAEFLGMAETLGIQHAARALSRLAQRDLGVELPSAVIGDWQSANPFWRRLNLVEWLVDVAQTDPNDDNRITVKRIRRRLRLVDASPMRRLAADVFFPPGAFLEWRWGSPRWRARVRHLGQLARKAVRVS